MSRENLYLSGRERTFADDEIIVSKTDPRGRLVYVNDVFLDVSGYTEVELLGQAHSIIRHPEMPRCVFKLLWDTIQTGEELFAYINNRAKNGDNYWVLAHVTPNFDSSGTIVGYHSNRRVPKRSAVEAVVPIYARLLAVENAAADRKQGQEASFALFTDILSKTGKAYDEFVLGL